MNTNLALVTSQNFGNVPCDFYQNKNDEKNEFYMTREQIGTALEYNNPMIAISKIHDRHSDRLDKFSVLTKLVNTHDKKFYDSYLYSSKGIYEICRWSRQPKANQFMDWVWEVIDNLRTGEYRLSQGNVTLTPQAIESIMEKYFGEFKTDMNKYLTTMSNSFLYIVKSLEQKEEQQGDHTTQTNIATPSTDICSSWKREMYREAKTTAEQQPELYKDYKDVLNAVYRRMRNVYGIVLDQARKDFKEKYNIDDTVKTLDVIYDKEQLKSLFECILLDMGGNIKPDEKVAHKSKQEPVNEPKPIGEPSDSFVVPISAKKIIPIPVHIELDPVKAVIAPLIAKRNDKTLGGNNTYREVYRRMSVCWANRLTRYRNAHGLKNNPSKVVLIKADIKLFNLFQKTVAEMLMED